MAADALVACGGSILLLTATSPASAFVVAGIALILIGAGLLWGVPPPPLRARALAAMAGLLVGFAVVRAS